MTTTLRCRFRQFWDRPKVDTLEAAEPLVIAAAAKARRAGGAQLRIEVLGDLKCGLAFAGRVKS